MTGPATAVAGPVTISASSSGRDADSHRARMGLDPEFPARRARAAVEFEPDLLLEPDPDLLAACDLGERRALRVPERDAAERPRPVGGAFRRHHPEIEPPVIR